MGKVKQALEEDMILNPENYNNPDPSEKEMSKQKEEVDDFIKQHIIIGTIKNETSRK